MILAKSLEKYFQGQISSEADRQAHTNLTGPPAVTGNPRKGNLTDLALLGFGLGDPLCGTIERTAPDPQRTCSSSGERLGLWAL